MLSKVLVIYLDEILFSVCFSSFNLVSAIFLLAAVLEVNVCSTVHKGKYWTLYSFKHNAVQYIKENIGRYTVLNILQNST